MGDFIGITVLVLLIVGTLIAYIAKVVREIRNGWNK